MKTGTNMFLNDAVASPSIAIFGKHPLAADHLEDIGLATASLIAFKQGMYIDGIGECLSRHAWFKDLGDVDGIPYDHHLLCVGECGWLAARLKHSSDAAGRKQYPLVLAIHSGEFAFLHQIGAVHAILEETLGAVEKAKSLQILQESARGASERLAGLLSNVASAPGSQARESWRQHMPGYGADGEGLWRCCHALMVDGAAAGRARVPLHPAAPWPSATLWASFLARLGVSLPLTILWRHNQSYADIWLSPPGSRVLGNLFTDATSQPLTSQVPFNITPKVKTQAESTLNEWLKSPDLFAQPAEAASSSILNKVCHNLAAWFKPSPVK